jgi:acyl-coenzyme A synthetase/AMP-(fatty) acid ligase
MHAIRAVHAVRAMSALHTMRAMHVMRTPGIVDTWWQTETGAIMISPLPGITATKPGSAMAPLPGISAVDLGEQVFRRDAEWTKILSFGRPLKQ